MRTKFSLPELSKVEFTINLVELDAASPLNDNEPHIHKDCEIYINLSGDVSFEVENRIYPISRGSVIITRPYEYHHCIYHSNKQHNHYWITFSAKESEDFLKLFFQREKGNNNLIVLNEQQLDEICLVLNELLMEDEDSLIRRINFLKIFQILRTGTDKGLKTNIKALPDDVTKALHYIDNHLTEDISIDMLSKVCSVSQNTLERHFKSSFGISPFVALKKKRLIASLEYLREGYSVSEASIKSGFSDYSNYIQLFRKQFGLTPLQYKKKFEIRK